MGNKKNKAKKCTFNGVTYNSHTEAAKSLGFSATWVGLCAANNKTTIDLNKKHVQKHHRRTITIDDVFYKSFREAELKLFGNANGRIYNKIKSLQITDKDVKITFSQLTSKRGKKCVDTTGKEYVSQRAMETECGFASGTISKRIANGNILATNRLSSRSDVRGFFRCCYYFDGVLYESLGEAKKWLHHDRAWIVKNCVVLPEYINKDTQGIKERIKKFDVIEFFYRDSQWNEDRIIEECDRRLKKYFVHCKLKRERV